MYLFQKEDRQFSEIAILAKGFVIKSDSLSTRRKRQITITKVNVVSTFLKSCNKSVLLCSLPSKDVQNFIKNNGQPKPKHLRSKSHVKSG